MRYEVEYTAPLANGLGRVLKVDTVEADSHAEAREQRLGQGRVVLSTRQVNDDDL